MKRFVFTCAALSITACELPDLPGLGTACTTEARPAISITPVDALTGDTIRAAGTATVRDGAFVETQSNTPPLPPGFSLAYERAGTYDITVDVPGYRQWTREEVRVRRGECHVTTLVITARLEK